MNLDKFYVQAEKGETIDKREFLSYIGNFENVIIWGCSALGVSVSNFLQENGVKISSLWDIRANEIKAINGQPVSLPFSDETDKNKTLVVLCVANNVIQSHLKLRLKENGYHNFVYGIHIYMGFICPSSKESGINNSFCLRESPCLKIFCPRQVNLFSYEHLPKSTEYPLNMNSVTLIVNQKCNLSCKYCTSYMSNYEPQERKNFPVENIIRDIDNFFSTVDSVSSITVMGGEPFMHPDISLIIKALLKYQNFGFISIATNGVYPIKVEQLDGLADSRVCVSFNNYLEALPAGAAKIYEQNISLVEKSGIFYSLGTYMNEWAIPSTLYDNEVDVEVMVNRKNKCTNTKLRCHQIKDGKVFPCDFANSVHFLKVADYSGEYIDLTVNNNLRERLYKYINAPYYRVCGHCRFQLGSVSGAAEQGKLDFISVPSDVDKQSYIPRK